jgi:hypothetical protein
MHHRVAFVSGLATTAIATTATIAIATVATTIAIATIAIATVATTIAIATTGGTAIIRNRDLDWVLKWIREWHVGIRGYASAGREIIAEVVEKLDYEFVE